MVTSDFCQLRLPWRVAATAFLHQVVSAAPADRVSLLINSLTIRGRCGVPAARSLHGSATPAHGTALCMGMQLWSDDRYFAATDMPCGSETVLLHFYEPYTATFAFSQASVPACTDANKQHYKNAQSPPNPTYRLVSPHEAADCVNQRVQVFTSFAGHLASQTGTPRAGQ